MWFTFAYVVYCLLFTVYCLHMWFLFTVYFLLFTVYFYCLLLHMWFHFHTLLCRCQSHLGTKSYRDVSRVYGL